MMILGGDFNARIETMLGETENNNSRKSKDKVINTEGKCLLIMTNERGWHIANGNVRGDEEGQEAQQ